MDIFADYKSGYWDIWLKQTMEIMPGIVGWFYGIHTPPMVKTYRLGPHLYKKLREIGGAPDAIGELINAGSNVPEITHEQRILVYKAEQECYTRYGFDPPEGI